jgi:uncharacterized protein (UPF0261 family)
MAKVYVVGTCDTKERELAFAKQLIQAAGVEAMLVDVSTKGSSAVADVPAREAPAVTSTARTPCSARTTAARRSRLWPWR